jgi:formylglycine-generating enzyme required for sulfatase activity
VDIDLARAQARAPGEPDGAVLRHDRTPPVIEDIMPRPEDGPPSSNTGDTSTTTNTKPTVVQRTVPGTAVGYEMVYVPAGEVTIADGDTEKTVKVGPFWIGRTEVPWELYDIYVFNLDKQGENPGADAVTRPSRPYIPPDRGFGHAGYPAISMTTRGATKFCEWLSAKTGRRYRVPTVAEWRLAALAGSEGDYAFGDDPEKIDAYAWTENNSPEKTQPIGQKKPNALGMVDVHGNVMEWCRTMDGEGFVACGGAYNSAPEDATAYSTAEQDWQWNMTDPQIPKSPWWLSDASWVGLRILCEDETVNAPAGEKP